MPDRRVLFFDGKTVAAFHWHSGQVRAEGKFRPDAMGLGIFEAYLASYRKSLFYLLADVAEEGFQLESIPYIQGADRAALIKRRLGQYYYGTPLSVGISLGREKTGRRDEQILFAALTRPDEFKPWLDSLRKVEVPLAGLFSVPLVLAENALPFVGQREHCLLLTLTSGGLRQTYFERGKMHFSRLSQLSSRTTDDVVATCNAEAAKTYQYLVGQRQIKRGTRLSALITAHADQAESLRAGCHSTADIQFEILDINTIAKFSRLLTTLTDSAADPLLIHQLLARPPKHQFASAPERRLFRLWQIRFGLNSVAWAILFSTLLLGARLAAQVYELSQNNAELEAQAANDNQRYQRLLDSLPKTALTPDNLRTAIAGFDHLEKRAPGFERMLNHLGSTLNEMPSVELQRLKWILAPSFDAKVGAGGTAPTATTAANGAAQPAAWLILDVEGRFPPAMASDHRTMIELLDRLATKLQRDDVKVVLTKRPVDVESAKSFKSSAAQSTGAESTAPQFTLRLGKPIAP
jgi:hypothetical protein